MARLLFQAVIHSQLLLHLHCAGNLPILLLHTLLHGGHDHRRSGDGQQRNAVMLQSATAKWFDLIVGSQQPRRGRTGRVRPKNRARCAAIHRSAGTVPRRRALDPVK